MNSVPPIKVFSTSGAAGLARDVCGVLQARLPKDLQPGGCLTLSNPGFEKFDNGSILPHIENVRDHLVVIICTHAPGIHDQLFELFHIIDAVVNADAKELMLAFSYYDYSRSDKKDQPRISVMSRFLAEIFNNLGIKKKLILDPHDDHVLQYFRPTANGISAVLLLTDYLKKEFLAPGLKENGVVVFSDNGAADRYREVAHILNLPTAYIDKQRVGGKTTPIRVVGNVKGNRCFLFDDEILTGGTAIGDANMLMNEGATSVTSLAIHGILSSEKISTAELIEKMEKSVIERFIITDSVPVGHKLAGTTKFTVIPVANLLAEAIKRTVLGESLTELYQPDKVSLYR
ncbi:MAG: ribose-phosphate diphosphokinase [Candidatus Wildermuthbacteria bacterium]|nr:ribose-phosphate diphosphokinase [Candidatus Wildermuthbacteria bacterium]